MPLIFKDLDGVSTEFEYYSDFKDKYENIQFRSKGTGCFDVYEGTSKIGESNFSKDYIVCLHCDCYNKDDNTCAKESQTRIGGLASLEVLDICLGAEILAQHILRRK